jgi:hypothetical protein
MTPKQREIVEEVSRLSGISIERILSPERTQYVVAARNQVMQRLYALNRYSLSQIGRVVNRNHTTVVRAVGQVTNRKLSRRGWHRPEIGHLHCPGCHRCRIEADPVEPAPPPPPLRPKFLVPYAGADADYMPKRREL